MLTLYHLSGFKCFEYYYQRQVLGELKSYFPRTVSNTQFLSLSRQVCFHAFIMAHCWASLSEKTNHYYIDSKKLHICHNLRFHSHRVFEGIAAREKSCTWG